MKQHALVKVKQYYCTHIISYHQNLNQVSASDNIHQIVTQAKFTDPTPEERKRREFT